jgi:hypothetical protein
MADEQVGNTDLEVNISPAPIEEDPAKAKLKKLFGES